MTDLYFCVSVNARDDLSVRECVENEYMSVYIYSFLYVKRGMSSCTYSYIHT